MASRSLAKPAARKMCMIKVRVFMLIIGKMTNKQSLHRNSTTMWLWSKTSSVHFPRNAVQWSLALRDKKKKMIFVQKCSRAAASSE